MRIRTRIIMVIKKEGGKEKKLHNHYGNIHTREIRNGLILALALKCLCGLLFVFIGQPVFLVFALVCSGGLSSLWH